MNKQQGFTLIELVVVIIILGILAVTAAPKFINLQDDAKASAIQGLKGAIQGANSLVYAKAALTGIEREATASVDVLGDTNASAVPPTGVADDVPVVYGYMAATEAALEAGMDVTIDASTVVSPTADWIMNTTTGVLYQRGTAAAKIATCSVTYTAATATAIATAVSNTTDC